MHSMFIPTAKCINMNKLILILLVFTPLIQAFGTQKDSLAFKELDFRVKKIEDYRSLDEQKFEVKGRELDLKVEEYRQEKIMLDWIALGVGGITIVSLFGFWYKVKSLADKKINEKLDKLLDEKRQQFVNIIESHDKEDKLKKNNKILIVASENSNTDFLVQFFKRLGFTKTELWKVSEYQQIDEQVKYDILFLFRESANEPLQDEIAKQYIQNSREDSVIFSFGNFIEDKERKKRMSSATFWSQLHGNLISALKYQELID